MSAEDRRRHLQRAVDEGGSIMTARGAVTRSVPSTAAFARTPDEKRAALEELGRKRAALDEEEQMLADDEEEGGGDKLPEDFPGRAALADARIHTFAELRSFSKDDLTALPGIGDATAEKIIKALR